MPRSSGDDKRQPRVGKLQFRGVGCVRKDSWTPATGTPCTRRQSLQRMTRGDLCVAPLVDEASGTLRELGAPSGALGLQALQPRDVDRLKWQRRLKTIVGCRVDGASGLQRALAIQVEPVALKAQCPAREMSACQRPTRRAQGSGRPAFQLATWKGNPLVFINLRGFDGDVPDHEPSLGRACDRAGHRAGTRDLGLGAGGAAGAEGLWAIGRGRQASASCCGYGLQAAGTRKRAAPLKKDRALEVSSRNPKAESLEPKTQSLKPEA